MKYVYERLTRLGRNLKPGDEVIVREDLGHGQRVGRVRVTRVQKGGRGWMTGRQEWFIYHSGPVAGNLHRHLWVGDHWSFMTCEADDSYDIFRPVGVDLSKPYVCERYTQGDGRPRCIGRMTFSDPGKANDFREANKDAGWWAPREYRETVR